MTNNIHFDRNTIYSNNNSFVATVFPNPYRPDDFVVNINNIDTKDVSDAYSVDDVRNMITFLERVEQELKILNSSAQSLPLFGHDI